MMISAMNSKLAQFQTWFSHDLAENMTKRESVAAERAILDTRMAAAMEEGKMNAWKRKGLEKKETATIQTLNKEIAANNAKMAALVQQAAPAQRIVDTFARWDLEASTMHEWSSGSGPEPEHIRQREQADLARLRADCVPVRFDPEHPLWSSSSTYMDSVIPTESWTSITPAAYLETLKPNVVDVSHDEEIAPVQTGSGTPAWMYTLMKKK